MTRWLELSSFRNSLCRSNVQSNHVLKLPARQNDRACRTIGAVLCGYCCPPRRRVQTPAKAPRNIGHFWGHATRPVPVTILPLPRLHEFTRYRFHGFRARDASRLLCSGGGLTDSRITKFQAKLTDLRFHNDLAHPFEDLVKDALNDYAKNKNDKLRKSIENALHRVRF